ncbi:uncharacterized protein LOC111357865 [Spodoptera litura]|uniref:Uncharacterized protein LOC111357865 n=1 Tax=Spodoptera litura TaxID=69820 RepID=A0A9J7IXB4_SPOLT|nr:uncharacterized protein LOC111357865 [Spodoptera litura]
MSSRQFWLEFLQLYRSFPCLWDTNDPAYLRRHERKQAYDVLLAKVQEVDETANVLMVKKKIDSFRTSFRREEKKVIQSLQAGDEIYIPTLWYYKELEDFLSSVNVDDHRNSTMSVTSYENDNENDDESQCMEMEQLEESSEGEEEECEQKYSPPSPTPAKRRKIPKPIIITRKEQDNSRIFAQPLSVPQTEEEDDCATFATHLKVQMRNINTEQKYIAQKLISDVMFLARTNRLTYNSSINSNLTYKTLTLPSKSSTSITVTPDLPTRHDSSSAIPIKIKTYEQ